MYRNMRMSVEHTQDEATEVWQRVRNNLLGQLAVLMMYFCLNQRMQDS